MCALDVVGDDLEGRDRPDAGLVAQEDGTGQLLAVGLLSRAFHPNPPPEGRRRPPPHHVPLGLSAFGPLRDVMDVGTHFRPLRPPREAEAVDFSVGSRAEERDRVDDAGPAGPSHPHYGTTVGALVARDVHVNCLEVGVAHGQTIGFRLTGVAPVDLPPVLHESALNAWGDHPPCLLDVGVRDVRPRLNEHLRIAIEQPRRFFANRVLISVIGLTVVKVDARLCNGHAAVLPHDRQCAWVARDPGSVLLRHAMRGPAVGRAGIHDQDRQGGFDPLVMPVGDVYQCNRPGPDGVEGGEARRSMLRVDCELTLGVTDVVVRATQLGVRGELDVAVVHGGGELVGEAIREAGEAPPDLIPDAVRGGKVLPGEVPDDSSLLGEGRAESAVHVDEAARDVVVRHPCAALREAGYVPLLRCVVDLEVAPSPLRDSRVILPNHAGDVELPPRIGVLAGDGQPKLLQPIGR
mmetsp:Transcript_25263/g.74300  ORF Transcript_25263/g.74300 Transcript_25263/m.74300 type:complete len:463 (-) Transcript_25263:633-2021(-)